MYNRSTIFQQSLPKPSWPGSHYLESLQELPALHVCIHTHISTQTWINMLMTGFSLIWDLVEMFLSGKCSVSARQLVKCPLDYCISSSQTCTEGSCRNVLHAICSVYSSNHSVIAFVCVFTYVCGFFLLPWGSVNLLAVTLMHTNMYLPMLHYREDTKYWLIHRWSSWTAQTDEDTVHIYTHYHSHVL